jgi:hypothetical protein
MSESGAAQPVFKILMGRKKSDMAESVVFIEFWINSTDGCLNSTSFFLDNAAFLKIGHHRIRQISANSTKFLNPDTTHRQPTI